ncbi:unnamed protein product [Sphagnum tenellum]
MGCSNSKVENEEVVARCRARKRFLKQAVYRRHAFAASHAQYVVALKGAGSAFRQFAEGEVKDPALLTSAASFLPEIPTTPPRFDLAPLPLPPPPPPMSPTVTPILSPTPQPPSPPRLELPGSPPPPQKEASSPTPAPKKPKSNASVPNGIIKTKSKIRMSKANRVAESMTMEEDNYLSLPPPPPLIEPASFEDDWRYVAQAPPPPPPLSREGMPPLPSSAHSSWQDLFLDPFRPTTSPSSFNYASEQQNQQQHDLQQPQRPRRFPNLNLTQLEEDIPELEDVDDEDDDIDGPPPKDSDDEEGQEQLKPQEASPIVKIQLQTNVQKQAEVLLPKTEVVKPKSTLKFDEEKTSTAIIPVAEEKVEKSMVESKKQLVVVPPEKSGHDLLEVLKEVDDSFLHAAESGEKVSRMLETKKVHYHSSFSDSFRGVGESARMLNVSFRRPPTKSGDRPPHQHRNGNHITFYSEESASIASFSSLSSSLSSSAWGDDGGSTGGHASTLDRLYAWEKKLYLEVKEAEALRIEFEKKCALYRNQDARGEDQLVIDRTRANIKMLQTRMAVAVHAVESAAAEVQRLRDDELYPQLLQLLEEMRNMWKELSNCHQSQMKAVEAMKRLDNSAASEPTTSSHRHSTAQLEAALHKWVESLSKLVNTQREYLKNLTGWLRLSLFHFVEPQRNGSRSPDRSQLLCENASPVYGLCQQWQTSMDQVPDRVAIEAIAGFASVVHEMLRLQCEELRIKKKVEFLARELEKREVSLHSASMRDFSFRPPLLHSPPLKNSGDNNGYEQNADFTSRGGPEVNERRQRMETVRRRLEEELEAEQKAHIDTRAYTLNSLQTGLPCLFQAMVTFSNVEAEIYERLYTMGDSRNLARITK